jgi:PilZ domain
MERAGEQRVRLPRDESLERRATIRFPMTLEVRYAVLGRCGPAETGSGRTIDLSSSGLSFTADRPLPIGQKLEVSIDWPVLLGGGIQLQLTMSGTVVRSNGSATALQVERHEFRTRRGGIKAAPLENGAEGT